MPPRVQPERVEKEKEKLALNCFLLLFKNLVCYLPLLLVWRNDGASAGSDYRSVLGKRELLHKTENKTEKKGKLSKTGKERKCSTNTSSEEGAW
jgi:hypothetical protein